MSVELVEVTRSGRRECVHRGSAVLLGPDGTVEHAVGEIHTPVFPRSSLKPLQAVALLRAGLRVSSPEQLAIATASHDAEPAHLELVRALLAEHGLGESDLRCPADLPGNEVARAHVLAAAASDRARDHREAAKRGARRIYMNCSGKHAAMLAVCRAHGWNGDYRDPDHPLQRAIVATVEDLAGDGGRPLAVDGCGVPIVPLSLVALARAFAGLVTAPPGSDGRRVADAVRAHPYLVSGSGRTDLLLMQAVPGLLCKIGADGVHAGALPDGTAFALKIDDGADRARMPATVALLQRVRGGDAALESLAQTPVLGGGEPVGAIRAIPGVLAP